MSFASVNDITSRLEKLEQNITLTLQEIDHNFSTCQYKVTTKILPQITRFACASEDIWENSKSLDLTTNDTFSATSSEDYINMKKKLVINETSSSKSDTSKTTTTINSILTNPSNYNSLTSTPLQEPQYVHGNLSNNNHSDINTNTTLTSEQCILPPQSSSACTDSDYEFAGISPPVTFQFSVAPSRLLTTPAKEAAKLIVDELVSCMSPDLTTPSNSNKGW
ncbi:6251_t:CDS:2 [Funneliformis geosporum]|uniref:DASH complex subunit ASK1 n=1 Tax=Funneliformis geosporum TaxID=1117311 RepID=A0A9W4SRX8_9GLOM|nr:6251_t:CDS:2 [Funneliformis geosporum]CAI2179056.1 4621_t:CDS:2 [Funneliformis geosporum]